MISQSVKKIIQYVSNIGLIVMSGLLFLDVSHCYAIDISLEAEHQKKRALLFKQFKPQKPRVFVLKNGLKLIVDVDKRLPVVSHTIWYKVGSADETKGETGIAHFLEHLLFKGTKKFPAGYFSNRVSDIGGEDNAFTTSDFTAYYQNVPKEYLSEMMQMEADRMVNLDFQEQDFKHEKNVVLEERALRIDNNPTSQLIEQMSAVLYRNHPYGSPVIGWQHEIKALNIPQVKQFYKKHYAPNKAVVTVVGDVDPDTVYQLAQKWYASIKPSYQAEDDQDRVNEPPQNVERIVRLNHKNVTVPSLFISSEAFSPAKQLRKFYAFTVALKAIAGGTHSILYKKLVKEQKLALSVGVFMSSDKQDNTSVTFQIIPAKGISLEKIKPIFISELHKIMKQGLSETVILREKNTIIADFITAFDSRGNRARFWGINEMLGQNMMDVIHLPQVVDALSLSEVNQTLHEIMTPTNRVWGELMGEEQ